MKNIIFSFALLLFGFSSLFALESQIILINSEAYLVDLDENYDVVNIHERIPDYFQDHSSHEEILAAHKESPRHRDIGFDCDYQKSDVFSSVEDDFITSCSTNSVQMIDYQIVKSNLGLFQKSNKLYWREPRGSKAIRFLATA